MLKTKLDTIILGGVLSLLFMLFIIWNPYNWEWCFVVKSIPDELGFSGKSIYMIILFYFVLWLMLFSAFLRPLLLIFKIRNKSKD